MLVAVMSATSVAMVVGASSPATVESRVDVGYQVVDGRALHVDVHRLHSSRPTPVLVFVHGGGWSRGVRPPHEAFDAAFAMGFSVVTVEYRLADEAPAPAAVRDVRCALAWVGREAEALGFDRRHIVVEGASAGGHLALLAVVAQEDPEFDAGCGPLPPIAALIDHYGITDLTTWHPASGAVERWLGPHAGDAGYLARLSPLARLHGGMPPIFITHGDADRVVPPSQSRALFSAATSLGVPVWLHVVPGGGHGGFDTGATARIDAALRTFLRTHNVPVLDGSPAPPPDASTGKSL
jgi:acetyl esterase/lipase